MLDLGDSERGPDNGGGRATILGSTRGEAAACWSSTSLSSLSISERARRRTERGGDGEARFEVSALDLFLLTLEDDMQECVSM